MRKIFFILCILFSFPSICLANYFDDNSERYFCYQNDERFKSYLDKKSITSIRYDPPYYSIDANIITFDYMNGIGALSRERYFYNYDTKEIRVKTQNLYLCYENGSVDKSYDYNLALSELRLLPKTSAGHLCANLAFFNNYRMFFDSYY